MSDQPPLPPIVIFSFTREDYLRRLCASLRTQQGVRLEEGRVHLVQDGARSPRSGNVYGDPARIEASIAAFREAFPGGHVHASADNLGIAMNIQRGEALVFETLDAEVGYFFEDDLELGPWYLATLEAMRAQLGAHPEIGYFAAYGDHRRVSDPDAPKLVPLEHHWGFGLTRRCWRAMQPWLQPFLRTYGRVDYQMRPDLAIAELYLDKPVAHTASSQDVAKTMACADLGFARVNTDVCFARYIGERGESFSPAGFTRLGFPAMAYATERPRHAPAITPAAVEEIIRAKRASCTEFRQTAFPARLEELRGRILNPDRLVTREELDQLWRLLMDRAPDAADYYANTVGRRTVREVRTALLRSREARGKSFYMV